MFSSEQRQFSLERRFAMEGVQVRCFQHLEGRALQTLTQFTPSLFLVWADDIEPSMVLRRLGDVEGLQEIPVVIASVAGPESKAEAWSQHLGSSRTGLVAVLDSAEEVVERCLEVAPELRSS